jgi:hypothetical protein
MKATVRISTVIISLFLMIITPVSAIGAIYEFQKAKGISIEILSQDDFNASFGNNPDVPRNDNDIIALAEKLFPPYGQKHLIAETDTGSREYELGILFGALQNPSVSQATRNAVDAAIAAAVPPLPKTYTSGHFKFFYTDNDPDPLNNVTLAQIQATATAINAAWDSYATNFKEPKHYLSGADKMVDVKVFDLGAGLYGETSSGWNHINLNSNLTVASACKRKTTSAHELFHRVQYAYGYVSGTANMKWIVEGTASWSQKFTNASVRDYMSRMIAGLDAPDKDLITERSYDAAHFWVYLQRRAGWDAIKAVWQTYFTNGKNAKAAVNTVTSNQLGLTFDQYAAQWAQANYVKDTENPGNYEYNEDEITQTSCGVVYGPLSHVPKTAVIPVKNTTAWGRNDTLKPYGADYYVFNLDAKLTSIKIKIDGDDGGAFRYYILGIKNNTVMSRTAVTTPDYTYNKTLTAGQWDRIVVIATGGSTGGIYTVKINNTCFAGQWLDNQGGGNEYYLNQGLTNVSGWVTSPYCTSWNVNGTYNAKDITWTLSGSPNTTSCCNWTITGAANETCTQITGTWVNVTTPPCNGETGYITINKTADMSVEPSYGPLPGLAQ